MLKRIYIISVLCSLFINSVLGGSLSGRVNFDGTLPKKKSLRSLMQDPTCGSFHKEPVYRQYRSHMDVYFPEIVICYFHF